MFYISSFSVFCFVAYSFWFYIFNYLFSFFESPFKGILVPSDALILSSWPFTFYNIWFMAKSSGFMNSERSRSIFSSFSFIAAFWNWLNYLKFSCNILNTFFILKIALNVLFFLKKQSLMRPSHSVKLIGGGGYLGSSRITLLSTLGGGLKLFLDTLIKWSTRAKS